MADGKVNWYANDVQLVVDGATDELLTRLAFQGEALVKVGITEAGAVDTGFMRNAVYAITPLASHRLQAQAQALAAAARTFARQPSIEEHEAAIHGAAEYTIYQEMRHHFLYRALERLKQVAPGVIREVGKRTFR